VSTPPVIRLEQVSLCYRLAKQRIGSFKEYAIHLVKGSLAYEKLWALRDVSLAVQPGDSVGIIGQNGAGKSTLLKVIAGVLKPTQGRIEVHGRVSPILELGTGFDFELTGLENIYLNALLLGRSRREIDRALDGIVAFSGLGDFVRSPIRNYSSGMMARLGFSVATGWVPEILILDEALSVGDARFLRRCEERLENFRRNGTTLLLVSHSPSAVRDTCKRAIWLDRGCVRAAGAVDEVLQLYENFSADDSAGSQAAADLDSKADSPSPSGESSTAPQPG
jgi:homopolymeric O-antigen transport system ATP-binding protein